MVILIHAGISVGSTTAYCKLGNGTVRNLCQDTVYIHPTTKQCAWEPDVPTSFTNYEYGSINLTQSSYTVNLSHSFIVLMMFVRKYSLDSDLWVMGNLEGIILSKADIGRSHLHITAPSGYGSRLTVNSIQATSINVSVSIGTLEETSLWWMSFYSRSAS